MEYIRWYLLHPNKLKRLSQHDPWAIPCIFFTTGVNIPSPAQKLALSSGKPSLLDPGQEDGLNGEPAGTICHSLLINPGLGEIPGFRKSSEPHPAGKCCTLLSVSLSPETNEKFTASFCQNHQAILNEDLQDEDVNQLIWHHLGYRYDEATAQWNTEHVEPGWAEKFPEPPNFIESRPATVQLTRSIPKEYQQLLKDELGFKGYTVDQLVPRLTRRATMANWLLSYMKQQGIE